MGECITWVVSFLRFLRLPCCFFISPCRSSVKLAVIRGGEDVERALKVLGNWHCRSCIVVLGRIVWCREEGDESAIGEEFGPILDNLQFKRDFSKMNFEKNKINQPDELGQSSRYPIAWECAWRDPHRTWRLLLQNFKVKIDSKNLITNLECSAQFPWFLVPDRPTASRVPRMAVGHRSLLLDVWVDEVVADFGSVPRCRRAYLENLGKLEAKLNC